MRGAGDIGAHAYVDGLVTIYPSQPLPRTIITFPQFSTVQHPSTSPNLKGITNDTSFNVETRSTKLISAQILTNSRVRISQQTIEYSPEPRENPPTFAGNLISLEESQQGNDPEVTELEKTIYPQEDVEETNSLEDQADPRNTDNVTFRRQRPHPTNATSNPTTLQNSSLQNATTNNNNTLSPIRHEIDRLQLNLTFEPIPPPRRFQLPNPNMINTNPTWRISDVQPQTSILTSTQHPMTDPSPVRLSDITELLKDVSLHKIKRSNVKLPTPHLNPTTVIPSSS